MFIKKIKQKKFEIIEYINYNKYTNQGQLKVYKMYHDTLNEALNSVGLGTMTALDVDNKIGSIDYEKTKRFKHDGKQVNIYRMPSGRYEIVAYDM